MIEAQVYRSQTLQGKFRGTVVNNADPMRMGRVQVLVPDVFGPLPTTWALPCLPFTGVQAGFYCVPPPGAGVWVEFEQGDAERPIWTGGWWGSPAEVPAGAFVPPAPPPLSNVVLQTSGQNTLLISDAPGPAGGILLKATGGASILVNDAGIVIQNGKGASIMLVGTTVTVNQGALVVL